MSTTNTNGKVLLLGSETCGSGECDLGYEIMVNFLGSLADSPHRLKAIIFWNTAVHLVAQGSPVVPALKRLEQQGVEVLSGILCLENLGLMDKLAVGEPVKMPRIIDLLLSNEVITV